MHRRLLAALAFAAGLAAFAQQPGFAQQGQLPLPGFRPPPPAPIKPYQDSGGDAASGAERSELYHFP